MFNLGNKAVSPKLDQSCQTLSSKRHKVALRLTSGLLGVTVGNCWIFSKQIPQKIWWLCLKPHQSFSHNLPSPSSVTESHPHPKTSWSPTIQGTTYWEHTWVGHWRHSSIITDSLPSKTTNGNTQTPIIGNTRTPPSKGLLKPPIITTTQTTQYEDYQNHPK